MDPQLLHDEPNVAQVFHKKPLFFGPATSPLFFRPVQLATGGGTTSPPVQMPPMQVPFMPDTAPLKSNSPSTMAMTWSPAVMNATTQATDTPLPFTGTGWKGEEIADKLGQYDRIPGTDSDAVRCVQAVALISHVLYGPDAVDSYLSSMILQGVLLAPKGQRRHTALQVIAFVKMRIKQRTATYGDLYWAMEAIHDLFYKDAQGTPLPDIKDQVIPMGDMMEQMKPMNVWCDNRTQLMATASQLKPGEQMILTDITVFFNFNLEEPGSKKRFRPIDTHKKPAHTKINYRRDHTSAHELLLFKDPTDKHIKIYQSEVQGSGHHLFDLTAYPALINDILFFDEGPFEKYEYVRILGRITDDTSFKQLLKSGS